MKGAIARRRNIECTEVEERDSQYSSVKFTTGEFNIYTRWPGRPSHSLLNSNSWSRNNFLENVIGFLLHIQWCINVILSGNNSLHDS